LFLAGNFLSKKSYHTNVSMETHGMEPRHYC